MELFKKPIFWIVFLASILGLWFVSIDPFLHDWDEKFHALVAKNISKGILIPHLYSDNVLNPNSKEWVQAETWLHKPPLTFYLIGLSLKIFGTNEIAVRIPSLIIFILLVFRTYQIGFKLLGERVGIISALLMATSGFHLRLTAGMIETDHVDAFFIFFVTSSLYYLISFFQSKDLNWIWIGVFVGLAVLTKWLVGFLAIGIWFLIIIFIKKHRSSFKFLIYSFLIALLLFLPWFIFLSINYQEDFLFNLNLMADHFWKPIEGHSGDFLFYFQNLNILFGNGDFVPFLVILSFIHSIWILKKSRTELLIYFLSVLSVYLFFSLAQTKMISFTAIVSPFLWCGLASLLVFSFQKLRYFGRKVMQPLFLLLIVIISILNIDIKELHQNHPWFIDENENYRLVHFKRIKNISLNHPTVKVMHGFKHFDHISAMFYNDIIAYPALSLEDEGRLSKSNLTSGVVLGSRTPSKKEIVLKIY